MKQDNMLIAITNLKTGDKKYFTKDKYVMEWIGCSQCALPAVKTNTSMKYSHDWKYSLEWGGDIPWKEINCRLE